MTSQAPAPGNLKQSTFALSANEEIAAYEKMNVSIRGYSYISILLLLYVYILHIKIELSWSCIFHACFFHGLMTNIFSNASIE